MTAIANRYKSGSLKILALAGVILILSLLLVRDADAHFLDMTQAWLYFDDATINMIATRASNNDLPLIRKDDELGLIFKAFPDQGTTFGMGGYVTFYPPEGTQVIGASYAFPDISGNLINIPLKSQSPVPHSAGTRGSDTIPELVGLSLGTNILGEEIFPVGPTGSTLGTLAGVSADTGIFYSTDPLTSWQTWRSSSYCTNPAGDCTVENQLGTATNPNNAWDAYQLLAYGSTKVGADVSIPADPNGGTASIDPSGHGSTARGLANPVAGPESGYAWQFNLDVWDGSGSVANFFDSLNDVGPWNRIQYPGSAISNDIPAGNGDLYAVVGVDGSPVGFDLNAAPLPPTLDYNDTTSTKAVRWSVGGIQKGRHEYTRITLKILANPGETGAPFDANGCFEAYAESFAGDAGFTDTNKDHIYRYYDPNTITLNPCSLLIKRAPNSTYPSGGTIPYDIKFLNLGTTTTLTGVQITDALPQPLVGGSSTDGTLTYYSGGPQSDIISVSSTNPYTWDIPSIPPGGIFEATLEMQASANGAIFNTLSSTGSFGSTSVTEIVQVGAVPALFLNKSVSPAEVAPGGTLQIEIIVENLGSGPSDTGQPIEVIDFLPDGFTYSSVISATLNGSPVSPVTSGTATDPVFTVTGPINPGGSLIMTFEAITDVNTPIGSYGNDGQLTYQDPIVGTSRLTIYGAAPVKVAASSIGDKIFYDWNGDGIQDPEDDGIPDVVLQLELPGGSITTTTTSAAGSYNFPSLTSGTYTVTVQSGIPPAFVRTFDPQGVNDGQAVVTVGAEDVITTVDFGYQPLGSGSIGDFIFIDSDGDGSPAGETGIDGATVYLYEDTAGNGVIDFGFDQVVSSTITSGGGSYNFSSLAEGFDYLVYIDPFSPVLETALGTGAFGATNPYPHPVTNLTGSYLSADLGFEALTPAVIGNQLFIDVDDDYLYTSNTDTPLPNIDVALYFDANNNGFIDPGEPLLETTFSNGSGQYQFGDLPPGSYLVCVSESDPNVPGGYALADDEIPVTLTTGETNNDIDFPFVRLVRKSVSSAVADPGDTLTYTLNVQYPGSDLLQNVVVTDVVPARATYFPGSANAGGTESGGVVTWILGSNDVAINGFDSGLLRVTGDFAVLQDNYLFQKNSVRNFGINSELVIDPRSNERGRPVLKFDLSPIPANAIIALALLELEQTGLGGSAAAEPVEVRALTESWDEGNATGNDNIASNWTNRLEGGGSDTPWTTAGGSFNSTIYDTTSAPDTLGEVEWNITSLVQDWVDGSLTNHGLLLKAVNETRDDKFEHKFSSREGVFPPVIYIEYDIPNGPPRTTRLIASPALAGDGQTVSVAMTLRATGVVTNVTPAPLTVVGTGGAAASCGTPSPTGPVDIPADTDVVFTYSCTITAGTATGKLLFKAGATSPQGWNFAQGTSTSVLVPLQLTFQATIDTPATIGTIYNTAFLSDDNFLNNVPSNRVVTILGELGAIGDQVWLDVNGDGVRAAGEDGIGSVTVRLKDGSGALVTTFKTGTDGSYLFPNLVAGSYTVEIDITSLPAGLVANPTFDEDGIGTPHTTAITLLTGQEYATADFGYNWVPPSDSFNPAPTATGAVGDRIWNDANGNGIQDSGESGLPNVTVTLYNDPDEDQIYNNVVSTTNTSTAGQYIFDDIAPDSYAIAVDTADLPAGFGTTPTGDPDGDGDSVTDPFQLSPGQVEVSIDFGYRDTGSAIGDAIFLDADVDGIQDPTEPGIPGVTINLLDGGGNSIATTLTDLDGVYRFFDLLAGSYEIQVSDTQNMLAGLIPASDPDGGLDNQSGLSVDGINDNLNQDFGYNPSGHDPNDPNSSGLIGDTVFIDTDSSGDLSAGEGVAGVTVNLYDGAGTVLLATTATSSNGRYFFGGLTANSSFLVRIDGSTLPGGGIGLNNSFDPDSGAAGESLVDLNLSGGTNVDQDFGYTAPAGNTIGGTLWTDANGDGTLNSWENGKLSGVTILLRGASGKIVARTTTSGDGSYSFTNLPDSSYTVEVTDNGNVLAGTWHSDGPNDGADNNSQIDPYAVSVSGGEINSTADFGYYTPPAIPQAAFILRVDKNSAAGSPDGSSWALAFAELQDAFVLAESLIPTDTVEIWVAQGIYYPDENLADDPIAIFHLKNGVSLYGGFAATETVRSQRDWVNNLTILSGDIDGNDTTDASGVVTSTANITGTNAYHVVAGSLTDSTALIDGFTITAGNANGAHVFPCRAACGGGMYIGTGSLVMTNLTFVGNAAVADGGVGGGGGAIFNYQSNPTMTNIVFNGNTAEIGAGIYNYDSSPGLILTNAVFAGNVAVAYGGGLFNRAGSATLLNVSLAGNAAGIAGGGLYGNNASSATITNTIISANLDGSGSGQAAQVTLADTSLVDIAYSLVAGGVYTGTGNISGITAFVNDPDPGDGNWATLGNNSYGDLHLRPASAAIDSGGSASCPGDDIRGFSRPFDGDENGTATCDMGAFEFAGALVAIAKGTTTENLSWLDGLASSAYRYQVWRHSTPYFQPGTTGSIVATISGGSGGTLNSEPAGGGYDSTANNYCYVVETEVAADGALIDYSNEVCEFTFPITPGS